MSARSPEPDADADAAELIAFGWRIADGTLAAAPGPARLVTHWFATADDAGVNADDHFGSNERTLRFLAVALPTLMDQLAARRAVVVVPWDTAGDGTRLAALTEAALGVIVVGEGTVGVQVAARRLSRVGPVDRGATGPFWRLSDGDVAVPAPIAEVAAALAAQRLAR